MGEGHKQMRAACLSIRETRERVISKGMGSKRELETLALRPALTSIHIAHVLRRLGLEMRTGTGERLPLFIVAGIV